MQRQPTLAEILADDTGKIRAEIADLLLEPNARRIQEMRQVPAHRAPRGREWIIFGLIVLLIFLVLNGIKDLNAPRPDPVRTSGSPQFPAEPIPVIQDRTENTIAVDDSNIQMNSDATSQVPYSAEEPEVTVRTGKIVRVIVASVSIRMRPDLQAEILTDAEENQMMDVVSFHNGWYQVVLPDGNSGYIFGAYLSPLNFDVYPYRATISKDERTNLLIKDVNDPINYQVIRPDGQTTWIYRDDVEIYQ